MLVVIGLCQLLHRFDVVELPSLVEIGFLGRVETEIRKPPSAWICLDPVGFTLWLLRTEIDIHRAVSVGGEVRFARRYIGRTLIGDYRSAGHVVIKRDRPELTDRRLGLDMEAVGLAAIEIVAVLIF